MDDALDVRGGKRLGGLGPEFGGRSPRHGSAGDPLAERLALQELHDREGQPLDAPQLVDGQDAGMRERRHRPGLPLEPTPHLVVVCEIVGQHFYGDVPFEARIVRSIHLSHAAGSEPIDDLVVRQTSPRSERFRRHQFAVRNALTLLCKSLAPRPTQVDLGLMPLGGGWPAVRRDGQRARREIFPTN